MIDRETEEYIKSGLLICNDPKMFESLNEDLVINDELNKDLFDSNHKLKKEVRDKILDIVHNFEEYINVPINIVDVQGVGSMFAYNYNEFSDIDVHIIANFETISEDVVLLQSLYDAKKSTFNKEIDIEIKGHKVELYVENIKSNVVSNGIYSICDDDWIKKPVKMTNIEPVDISNWLIKWESKINDVVLSGSAEEIKDTIDTLYLIRKNSIASDGEFGIGNQLFKDLRNSGSIKKLKDKYKEKLGKELSLEDYRIGKIINILDD